MKDCRKLLVLEATSLSAFATKTNKPYSASVRHTLWRSCKYRSIVGTYSYVGSYSSTKGSPSLDQSILQSESLDVGDKPGTTVWIHLARMVNSKIATCSSCWASNNLLKSSKSISALLRRSNSPPTVSSKSHINSSPQLKRKYFSYGGYRSAIVAVWVSSITSLKLGHLGH